MREEVLCAGIGSIANLLGLLGALPTLAEDTPIDIKTDIKGQYLLVEKGGNAANPTLVVKRTGLGNDHFVKREFDCAAHTVRYLGEGETLEEMNTALPEKEVSPIGEGSIPDQLSKLVCPQTQPAAKLTRPFHSASR